MFRFAFRVLGLWLLAAGFAAAVIDGMKSIAASSIVATPALTTWTDLAPGSHAAAIAWIERALGASAKTWFDAVLGHVPSWALLGVLGALIVSFSLPREERSVIGG